MCWVCVVCVLGVCWVCVVCVLVCVGCVLVCVGCVLGVRARMRTHVVLQGSNGRTDEPDQDIKSG